MPKCWGTTLAEAKPTAQIAPVDAGFSTRPVTRLRVFLAAGLVLCSAALASAAPSSLPQISDSTKQSSTLSKDTIAEVDGDVAAVAKVIADGSNPSAQSAGRIWLIQNLSDSSGGPASDGFVRQYVRSVNQQLTAIVTAPDANIRAKIQAGLAAEKISQSARGTELVGLVSKLMADPSPAVALIGIRATGALLPAMLNKDKPSKDDLKLLNQIPTTVAQHPDPPLGAPIALESYEALLQPVLGGIAVNPARINQIVVPLVLQLEDQRLKLYEAGPPSGPQADSKGLVALLSRDVWTNLTTAQKKTAMALATSHITVTAKWAQVAKSPKSKLDSTSLVEALQTDGKELQLFADPAVGVVPDTKLNDAASHLAGLGPGSGAGSIGPVADAVVDAIKDFSASN